MVSLSPELPGVIPSGFTKERLSDMALCQLSYTYGVQSCIILLWADKIKGLGFNLYFWFTYSFFVLKSAFSAWFILQMKGNRVFDKLVRRPFKVYVLFDDMKVSLIFL